MVGLDEVGRGPLAGPVTAGAVCFYPGYKNKEIKDSKELTHPKRELLYEEITKQALAYSIVSVGPRRIEKLNIREASRLAMSLASLRLQAKLQQMGIRATLCLCIDGNVPLETTFYQETIIKGDQKLLAIQAASIIAKVSRDRLMAVLDKYYPGYDFSIHKGYPTAGHARCIKTHGPSPVHRKTFAGVLSPSRSGASSSSRGGRRRGSAALSPCAGDDPSFKELEVQSWGD